MGAGALRLLLLALLSVGVIGMHTVGHANDHSSWDGPSSETVNHAAGPAMAPTDGVASWLTDATDPCDGNCGGITAVAAVRPGSDTDPAPDGTGLLIVCLAVLGGLGALALLAGALARRHRALAREPSACPARPARAAPTLVHRFPIRLVEVAVLRI
jgi:hypothetical protein